MIERLRAGLAKTRESLAGGLGRMVGLRRVDPAFWDGLEEMLIGCDIGVAATEIILSGLRRRALERPEEAIPIVKEEMVRILTEAQKAEIREHGALKPWVSMVVGVNGTGKTTTIAKLAKLYRDRGERVLVGACDTYRPAAQEQLRIWAERVGVDFIGSQEGADPASVAYDALSAALTREKDDLIIDTAGRVHTRADLMDELAKIRTVLGRRMSGAPQEVLLVLDATTGQNAISQANLFNRKLGTTGLVLSKLDGTARGGIVVAISLEFKIPVKWLGVGEGLDDLAQFDPRGFVEAMLG